MQGQLLIIICNCVTQFPTLSKHKSIVKGNLITTEIT